MTRPLLAALMLSAPVLTTQAAAPNSYEALLEQPGLYWPRAELQGFYSRLHVSGNALNPNVGYGAIGSVTVFRGLEVIGDASQAEIETRIGSAIVDVDADRYRGGLRYHWAARSGTPVYLALSAQYVRQDFDFGAFGEQRQELPLGHARAGYRTGRTHFYGEYGYGSNQETELQEVAIGLTYQPIRALDNLDLFGEYRSARVEFDDEGGGHARFKDLRLGIGYRFD